jgi:radical SAM protein with 4Fe4S-binding SPASM domain
MLQAVKDKVRILASTSPAFATLLATAFGVLGLLRRRRGSIDHVKSTLSLARRSTTIAGRPMNVTIEPTNVCNLECPVCETGAGVLGRESGSMTLEQFRTIIDKMGAHMNTLMFYFMGEPFLNKHAYEMIRYAKDQGVPFVETTTNGDFVKPEQLVECGLDRISFQIGGMTQRTHQIYRINSTLERVLANLEATLLLKGERRSRLRVESGFILMKHNEHEVPAFLEHMKQLGVDRASVIDPCVRTMEQGRQLLPTDRAHWIYDPEAFERGVLRPRNVPDNACPWIYYSLAIHVNGDVVPCCRDPRGEEVMGNIFEQDLDEIWNGDRYKTFRGRILTAQGSVGICRLCSSYPVSAIR